MTRPRRRRVRRRGSLYLAVLGVAIIVAIMGLAAMQVARMNLKAATAKYDRYEAGLLGASAVENALVVIHNNPNWRNDLNSEVEYPSTPVQLGRGTFTWQLVDDDGDLGDDDSDTVLLQGIGRVNGKTHVEQVRLQPTTTGLTCLEASLHCHGDLDSWTGAHITTNQMVSTNGHIWFTGGGQIFGNAEAVDYISAVVSGSETTGITPRKMPGSAVFDYYINAGTMIEIDALAHDDHYDLQKLLLSPLSNPYGNPNPEGIYVIDCKGGDLRVKSLRVHGTLVLLNPGHGSRIEREVHFEPAAAHFPSLLVDGNIQFKYDSYNPLDEGREGVNFNPPGTPYQGTDDSDSNDIYPCVIKGLIYVSGQLELPTDFAPCDVDGVVVCNSIALNSQLRLTYQSASRLYPPPGFTSGNTMAIIPGSWARVPSP